MTAEEIRIAYEQLLHLIPNHMRGGVIRYMEQGIRPGDFLCRILMGEFDRAFDISDGTNLAYRSNWKTFQSSLPPIVHGSKTKFDAWIAMNGLAGMPRGK